MKTCPKCSTQNQDAARFCNNCGTSLNPIAPNVIDQNEIDLDREKKRKTGNIVVLILGIIVVCYSLGYVINKIPNNGIFMTRTPTALKISISTSTLSPTPKSISGGIGLSKLDWEKKHTRSYVDSIRPEAINYDKVIDVIFKNGHVHNIFRTFWRISVDDPLIEQEIINLTPLDKEFIKSSIVEIPEMGKMKVDVYFSEILKDQIENHILASDFEPWADFGYFVVVTVFYEGSVAGILVSPGVDEGELFSQFMTNLEITSTTEILPKKLLPSKTDQPPSDCPQGCIRPPIECKIKGNISINTGEKIYHLPGDKYYSQTTINPAYGELWFCTENEAIANGWRHTEQ